MHLFYEAIFTKKKTPEELSGVQGSFVDVRDVARAHVRALEVEGAGGQRIITSAGEFIWQDWRTYPSVSPLEKKRLIKLRCLSSRCCERA